MRPIVKSRLTKDGISITLHTEFRYEPLSFGGIGLFDPILIQGVGRIFFITKHFWKPTQSCPLLCDNLSTLQLEAD